MHQSNTVKASPALAMLTTLVLLSASAPVTADDSAGPRPTLTADTPTIKADEVLTWTVSFRLINPLGVGIYSDSMFATVEDLDPGETRESRISTMPLPFTIKLIQSIGAGDTMLFDYITPATAERAHLDFRLYLHRADGQGYVVTDRVEANPGPVSARYPSQFANAGGKRVEYVLIPARSAVGETPGLMLVHGHGNHARRMLRRGMDLSRRGYTVMLVSQPGYGQSDGPADFMGPATVSALSAALDVLKHTAGVDSTRLGAWGVSRGATAVTELAERRSGLAAVVSQSGIYDLWAAYRGTQFSGIRDNILAEVGSDSSAWRVRSPALSADRLKSAILILHGEKDANVPVGQAHAFADQLKAMGAPAESHFYPGAEHTLLGDAQKAALDFLSARLLVRK